MEILPLTEPTLKELIGEISRSYGMVSETAVAIARCESNLNHYRQDGEVLRGRKNPYDIGVFQINEKYHLSKSQELGFDIYTPNGNIEYALWLMNQYGQKPWRWSRDCWD